MLIAQFVEASDPGCGIISIFVEVYSVHTTSSTRGAFDRGTPYVMTIVFAAFVYRVSFPIWEWAMPVIHFICDGTHELLTLLGVSQISAEQLAPYSDRLVLSLLHFLYGAVIGAFTRSRWRRFAIIFILTLFARPYFVWPRDFLAIVHSYGWKALGFWAFVYFLQIAPAVILGAWLASSPRKRRRERRRAAQLCEACGYSLSGNTSGVCPECGMSTSQEIKRPAMAEFIRRLKWPDPDPNAGQGNPQD